MVDSLSWSQPSLLESRPPARLRYEALVDPDDQTVVLVVEVVTFPDRKLIALSSSAPIPFDSFEETARVMAVEFTRLLREHTGPF